MSWVSINRIVSNKRNGNGLNNLQNIILNKLNKDHEKHKVGQALCAHMAHLPSATHFCVGLLERCRLSELLPKSHHKI